MTSTSPRPRTLGELRDYGYQPLSVRDEMRRNLEARLRAGRSLTSAVRGYDATVLPQLETALLAGHDVILLGERGQAKTRLIRALVELLDDWIPIVAGSPVRDDPLRPVSVFARDLLAEHGEDTPVEWVPRSARFAEKLATPDTSMADLIGDIDPIKVAGGLYLDDPRALSFGLVPKSHRGIFAINELPDLAERIQVGLLNVLEERDVQIRTHLVRLEVDVVVVATANPEDYTNRGRLITPLKDRFGSQIRTHYPFEISTEIEIMREEASLETAGMTLEMPWFIEDVIARTSHVARASQAVSQRSGVSVRLSIANYETVVASATRRALRHGEESVVPRMSDLVAMVQSTQGKIEFDTLDEDDAERVIPALIALATRQSFAEHVVLERAAEIVAAFDGEVVVEVGEDVATREYTATLEVMPALREAAERLANSTSPGLLAAATEFILEGLYVTKRLGKDTSGTAALYRSRSR